jgi:hypothetical protein
MERPLRRRLLRFTIVQTKNAGEVPPTNSVTAITVRFFPPWRRDLRRFRALLYPLRTKHKLAMSKKIISWHVSVASMAMTSIVSAASRDQAHRRLDSPLSILSYR